jgi:hypothetical protein
MLIESLTIEVFPQPFEVHGAIIFIQFWQLALVNVDELGFAKTRPQLGEHFSTSLIQSIIMVGVGPDHRRLIWSENLPICAADTIRDIDDPLSL